MPDGVIIGGWSYVIAAYSITAITLIVFAARLLRKAKRPLPDEDLNSEL